MAARPHTILKTLKQESNNQLCLALNNIVFIQLKIKLIIIISDYMKILIALALMKFSSLFQIE